MYPTLTVYINDTFAFSTRSYPCASILRRHIRNTVHVAYFVQNEWRHLTVYAYDKVVICSE